MRLLVEANGRALVFSSKVHEMIVDFNQQCPEFDVDTVHELLLREVEISLKEAALFSPASMINGIMGVHIPTSSNACGLLIVGPTIQFEWCVSSEHFDRIVTMLRVQASMPSSVLSLFARVQPVIGDRSASRSEDYYEMFLRGDCAADLIDLPTIIVDAKL